MGTSFERYGKATRKFQCNPPTDVDFQDYGQKSGVKFEWLRFLIVRLSADAQDDEQYILTGKDVTIRLNPRTLRQFIEAASSQLSPKNRFGIGRITPCGLYFSPDWLGAE